MTKYYPVGLHQLEDWHIGYNIRKHHRANCLKFSITLASDVDLVALEKAYNELFRRFEMLRTTFPKVGNEVVQCVHDPDSNMFALEKVYTLAKEEIAARERKTIESLRDLQWGPLARGFLFIGDDERIFRFFIHHILVDAWSIIFLKRKLIAFYMAFKDGATPGPETSATGFGQYLVAHKQTIEEAQERNLSYWTRALENSDWKIDFNKIYLKALGEERGILRVSKSGRLDQVRQRNLYRRQTGQMYSICMPDNLYQDLHLFSAQLRIGKYGVLIACMNLLGASLAGNQSILIRSHYNNRHKKDVAELVANCIGSVLLLNKIEPGITVREFILRCYSGFLESVDRVMFSSEPLDKLGALIKCFVAFNFISKEVSDLGETELHERPILRDNNEVISPLFCTGIEHANTILFKWGYHLQFYDFEIVEIIVNKYFDVIRSVVDNPDTLLSELELAETKLVL